MAKIRPIEDTMLCKGCGVELPISNNCIALVNHLAHCKEMPRKVQEEAKVIAAKLALVVKDPAELNRSKPLTVKALAGLKEYEK